MKTDISLKSMRVIVSGSFDKILMFLFSIGAIVGVWFFLTHWDRPVTDVTIFSAILVELPIQFYFQKKKNETKSSI